MLAKAYANICFFKCLNYWYRDNPFGANKIRVVLLLTTYETEAGDTNLFKEVYVDYVWKKQIREENKCFNIPWSLHTKDNLQSLATKKAHISELLFLRYLPKCMISQRFFLYLSSSLLCSVLWISVCLFVLFSFVSRAVFTF